MVSAFSVNVSSYLYQSEFVGILFIVSTPIGNLEDITRRAVRVLGEVSLIACEDTRHTRKLLDHLGITTPVTSYHEHNEAAKAEDLIARLQAGSDVVFLVSDAGRSLPWSPTPGTGS